MSAFLRSVVLFVLGVVLLSAGPSAQRGGRGGDVARPTTPNVFDSEELKIRFDVPEGLRLYTVAAPGRYKEVLINGRFLHLDSAEYRDAVIDAKFAANTTEADLKAYMKVLETAPPQAKLPGFKKVSLKAIKIGKQADKDAISYVYNVDQNGTPKTVRQVVFVHNGNGFTFTCSSLEPEYGGAEISMYGLVFARLEFK